MADTSARGETTKKTLSASEEEALLVEIRERRDEAWDGVQEAHKAGDKDMLAIAGDPWEPHERKIREDAFRPCLSLDEIGQYIHEIVNDVRANPIAMKFDPTGRGASEKGAEFYQDKAREIEYRSHAQVAYTTAFENAVQRGYGWVRVKTECAHPRTEEQEICIDAIVDPNAVLPDRNAIRPDSSDMQYLFYVEGHEQREFKRRWPWAKVQDFSGDIAQSAPSWISGDRVQVGEYWKIKKRQRELMLWQTPQGQQVKLFDDEALEQLPARSTRVQSLRVVDFPSVCQYLTNGVEILATEQGNQVTEWAGKYIPFVSCYGKIVYLTDGAGTKRIFVSATRLGRDPYMLYCYYRTQQAEMAGMIPKVPVQAYEGQMAGHEEQWQKANHEPVAFLYFKGTTDATGATVLPPPQRLPYTAGEHLQALELCAEGARRAIQAAMMGSPLPTSAQRRNEKSGVALKQIESSRQKGSFHFYDHYKDMVRQVAVITEDLMTPIYDTARDVGTRQANETAKTVRINDSADPESIDTRGDYLVTVSTGPSFDSQRDEASDFADTLAQNPQVFPLIGPMIVRLKKLGPIGDEIAEALEVLQPPELRAKKQEGKPPDPRQLAAELAQVKQQLQQASEFIKTEQAKSQGQLQGKQIDAQADAQKAQATIAADMERARMDGEIKLRIAAMDNETKLRIEELKLRGLAMQGELDMAEAALQRASGIEQQQAKQGHEQGMARMGHEASMQQGEQGHLQGLEAGEAEAARQQALAEQQAQPQATNGGGA